MFILKYAAPLINPLLKNLFLCVVNICMHKILRFDRVEVHQSQIVTWDWK